MKKLPETLLTREHLKAIVKLLSGNPITSRIIFFDHVFVEKTISKRIQINQIHSAADYLQLLAENKTEQLSLIRALFIGYTEFFRNPLTFAFLEQVVFPALANKSIQNHKKEIRIWSAACATGQEVYSLAILLEELKKNANFDFAYRIFATDVSADMLEKASAGLYNESEIGNLSVKRLKQWFKSNHKSQFLVNPLLKNHIEFSEFDLLNKQHSCPPSSIFGDFDLIICANLLFYYKNDIQQKILGKLVGCINSEGVIVCDEVERQILKKFGLSELIPPAAIFKIIKVQY